MSIWSQSAGLFTEPDPHFILQVTKFFPSFAALSHLTGEEISLAVMTSDSLRHSLHHVQQFSSSSNSANNCLSRWVSSESLHYSSIHEVFESVNHSACLTQWIIRHDQDSFLCLLACPFFKIKSSFRSSLPHGFTGRMNSSSHHG